MTVDNYRPSLNCINWLLIFQKANYCGIDGARNGLYSMMTQRWLGILYASICMFFFSCFPIPHVSPLSFRNVIRSQDDLRQPEKFSSKNHQKCWPLLTGLGKFRNDHLCQMVVLLINWLHLARDGKSQKFIGCLLNQRTKYCKSFLIQLIDGGVGDALQPPQR